MHLADRFDRARLKARDVTGRMAPGCRAVVLAYHRVADHDCDPDGTAVSPHRFAEQIRVLSQTRRIIGLDELRKALLKGGRAELAAVTFDDAYHDFLTGALPILERYGCPATIFVATGAIGATREFWWDELTRILSADPVSAAPVAEIVGRLSALQRSAPQLASLGGLELRSALMNLLWRLDPVDIARIIEELALHTGVDLAPRDSHRTMNHDEVQYLSDRPLIRLAAHGVTHRPLTGLDRTTLKREIRQSRRQCEEWSGRPVIAFAYPFGAADRGCREEIAAAGLDLAFGTGPGLVTRWADLRMLPRLEVRNWTADEFAQAIAGDLPVRQ